MEVALLVEVRCLVCNSSTRVPEPVLLEIAQYLQGVAADDGLLRLVCRRCQSSFPFDYARRWEKVIGIADMPLDDKTNRAWFAISGKCSRSCSPTMFLAIRPFGATSQSVEEEFTVWRKRGIACDDNHRLVSLSILPAGNSYQQAG